MMEYSYAMSTEELAKAIATTIEFIGKTGTAVPRYKMLNIHLDTLLECQAKRASLVSLPEPPTKGEE